MIYSFTKRDSVTDLAVATPNQLLTADEVEVSDLYHEDKIPAGVTNAVEVVSQVEDPAALSYIVTTRSEDGESAEVLTVGLDRHFKNWNLEDIVHWIEGTYHRKRRQRGLGKLTPIEYEAIINPQVAPAA